MHGPGGTKLGLSRTLHGRINGKSAVAYDFLKGIYGRTSSETKGAVSSKGLPGILGSLCSNQVTCKVWSVSCFLLLSPLLVSYLAESIAGYCCMFPAKGKLHASDGHRVLAFREHRAAAAGGLFQIEKKSP